MFIIVQNTVKQTVISIFDQISQRCLVGSTQSVTVGELKVSPWLTAPGMEDEQLGRRGLSASQPMAERD